MSKTKSKRRDLKFLWLSNALYTQSGYAVETRDILTRLRDDGWQFAQVANHGVESHPVIVDGIKIYPKMGDPHGSDAILYHAQDFGAQVIFIMLDLWILNNQYLSEINNKGLKIIPWIPIDQEPVNPGVIHNLKQAYKILTFSRYGQSTLEKEGFASTLILEGIDTDIFKPMDKYEIRNQLRIPPNVFLFGMIGANKENPPRKGYQEALEAFKMFSESHPDAMMYFHCQQLSGVGFPIQPFAEYLGISDKILYLDQYKASFGSDSHHIAKEINAFDVLLHPSMTEGFGLLSVEAQSCGVPVIVNNCTSMPELVIEGKTGWISDIGKPFWRNGGGYIYPADVNSLRDQMEKAHQTLQDPKEKEKISKACRKNILQNYNINDIVKDKWIPFLEELQEEVLSEKE